MVFLIKFYSFLIILNFFILIIIKLLFICVTFIHYIEYLHFTIIRRKLKFYNRV